MKNYLNEIMLLWLINERVSVPDSPNRVLFKIPLGRASKAIYDNESAEELLVPIVCQH